MILHQAGRGLRQPESPIHIGLENRMPCRGSNVRDRPANLPSDTARRIDKDIETACRPVDRIDGAPALGLIPDIEMQSVHAVAGGKFADAVLIEIGRENHRTRLMEFKRDRLSDPLRAAGDQNYALIKAAGHGLHPRTS
jgi:hypothetical protein